jgi:hypothetical protein
MNDQIIDKKEKLDDEFPICPLCNGEAGEKEDNFVCIMCQW